MMPQEREAPEVGHLIDCQVLRNLEAETNREVVDDFLYRYQILLESSLNGIRSALHHQDGAELTWLAHRLRSSSLSLGAFTLGLACEVLEEIWRQCPQFFAVEPQAIEVIERGTAVLADLKRLNIVRRKNGSTRLI